MQSLKCTVYSVYVLEENRSYNFFLFGILCSGIVLYYNDSFRTTVPLVYAILHPVINTEFQAIVRLFQSTEDFE